nr:MAG TPA: Baseplate wedge protein [Bacteriophage sp.]DAO69961.1 MAG TPA: Baseplate wedge protein [Bacteriophage sp.]
MSDLLLKMPLNYEPHRKNRWVFRFPSDLGIQEWYLSSASRPSIKQNPKEIPFLNTSTWVVGRYTWDAIQVKLRDPIGPSASQAVMEWVRLHSESVTGRQGYAAGYKRDIEIEMLDPGGVVVSKWILKNTMLTDVKFGDLDYSQDDLADISMTLQYDYAILAY